MDASWVAAIASVASAFVVGVATLAALRQLRHIRNANDITVYLRLVERLESSSASDVFHSFQAFARKLETDGDLRYRMAQSQPLPEFDEIEQLLRFFDSLTLLQLTGSVTERLIVIKYAHEIVQLWDSLAEAVYLRRYGIPHFAATYEHLAMRAKAQIADGTVDRFYDGLLRDPSMARVSAPQPPTE